jgi:transcriptional regulator with XRE-family HTH domain
VSASVPSALPYLHAMTTRTTAGVGVLLKDWRGRRRRSQLDLAHEAGVSPRHLSFVETGRSRPSAELVLTLAEHLEVPLRDRNALLLAAGYAPRFQETSLSDPEMRRIRASLQLVLDSHDPYPGVVLDRRWDVVLANTAALRLVSVLPPALCDPVNVFRAGLQPDGLAGSTTTFDEWGAYLVHQLHRLVVLSGDRALRELDAEVREYPTVRELTASAGWRDWHETPLLVRCELELGGTALALFTTLTTFGTPRDITLDELAIELFYPADDATEVALRGTDAVRSD